MANNNNIYKMSNAGGFKSLNRYYDMLAGNTVWNPFEPAGAYESIASITVPSGGASSISFVGVPQNYAHLQIRGIARDSRANAATNLYIQYNGDTGANYTAHELYGNGSSAVANFEGTSQTSAFAARVAGNNSAASSFGGFVIDVLDYANTNKYKTNRSLAGHEDNSSGAIWLISGLWLNTSAVTSITITPVTSPILQYSQFALYGIKG
jgi:hypothetical protein